MTLWTKKNIFTILSQKNSSLKQYMIDLFRTFKTLNFSNILGHLVWVIFVALINSTFFIFLETDANWAKFHIFPTFPMCQQVNPFYQRTEFCQESIWDVTKRRKRLLWLQLSSFFLDFLGRIRNMKKWTFPMKKFIISRQEWYRNTLLVHMVWLIAWPRNHVVTSSFRPASLNPRTASCTQF